MTLQEPLESSAKKVDSTESDTPDSISTKKANELKMVSVKLPIHVIERVKRYQKSDMARRVDTQSYIFEQAITQWLDEKGFEK